MIIIYYIFSIFSINIHTQKKKKKKKKKKRKKKKNNFFFFFFEIYIKNKSII